MWFYFKNTKTERVSARARAIVSEFLSFYNAQTYIMNKSINIDDCAREKLIWAKNVCCIVYINIIFWNIGAHLETKYKIGHDIYSIAAPRRTETYTSRIIEKHIEAELGWRLCERRTRGKGKYMYITLSHLYVYIVYIYIKL